MSQRYIGGLIYNPPGGFSGYFDGSGDYLSAPDNAAWYFTGDFTVECWAYWSSVSSSEANVLAQHRPASAANQAIEFWSNGTTLYLAYSSSSVTTTIAANQWYHLAMSCTSGTASCYVNGVRIGTFSMPTRIDSADPFTIGARTGSGGSGATGFFTGYISNVRVINGTGIYSGASFDPPVGPLQAITNTSLLTCAYSTFRDGSTNNFTITVNGNTAVSAQNPFPLTQLPNPALGNQGNGVYSMSQYQALRSQNLWPAIDQYWPYVTLMLHGNGTNGAQNNTFLDSSTNNFTITRNGNTTQGTFTPYGSNWSNYFDASSATPLNFPDNDGFTFNADFTVECWFFATTLGEQKMLVSKWDNTQQEWALSINTSNTAEFFWAPYSTGAAAISSANAFSLNTWNHMAAVRSGSTITLYVNGVSVGTRTDGTAGTNRTSILTIGYLQYLGGNKFGGYISNVRVVKGTAVYTSNFTPSASPLTAITNTQLLTCQSNRFIDNSANNFTATVNGVSVQRFSPFNPTTPYAAGTIGGSGYFDGTGDFLNTPSTGQFAPAGDFTISCWYYPTSTRAYQQIIGNYNGSASTVWIFEITSGTGINFYTNGTTPRISGSGLVVNAWNYLVLARSGSTITGYVNGVSVGTYSQSGTFGSATQAISIGRGGSTTGSGDFGLGYIADVKLIDGSAVTTVPTAPQTATSGTQFLANFTNGGIIDNAMMNDLETVGNAQISTSVSKFGGGSLAFDGSGDYLTIPPTQQLNFGSGNFTFEFWAYLNTTSGSQAVWHTSNFAGDTPGGVYIRVVSGAIEFAASTDDTFGTRVMVTSSTSLSATTWTHVACVRNGNTLTIYINGTSSGSATFSGSAFWSSTYYTRIGYWRDGDIQYLNAYLDDFRITKGYARYTANFTPQRSQWQDQ